VTERKAKAGAAILAVAAATLPAVAGAQPGGRSPPAAHARPGHLAELEELDAARRAGTRAAYDMFLARHPESRYAPEARREREKLNQ
jgi:hypothetical protein